jgi:hypothetical protein
VIRKKRLPAINCANAKTIALIYRETDELIRNAPGTIMAGPPELF